MHGVVLPTLRWSLSLQLWPSGNVPEIHPEVSFLDSSKSCQVMVKIKHLRGDLSSTPFSL